MRIDPDMANNRDSRSKVARLIDEHDLNALGAELENRWTRDEDRSSLRDLADYFNRQVLGSVLESAEAEPLEGEIDNLYRLLTDDDVTSGTRAQARSRLQQRGIDVNSLEDSFVSYQSIRTYLRDLRDVAPPDDSQSPQDHRATKRNTIQQLVSRLDSVVTGALTELERANHLTLGEFDVIVTVRIHCTDCDTRLSISELFSQDGCQCDE